MDICQAIIKEEEDEGENISLEIQNVYEVFKKEELDENDQEENSCVGSRKFCEEENQMIGFPSNEEGLERWVFVKTFVMLQAILNFKGSVSADFKIYLKV